jgi:hypothetical protein
VALVIWYSSLLLSVSATRWRQLAVVLGDAGDRWRLHRHGD